MPTKRALKTRIQENTTANPFMAQLAGLIKSTFTNIFIFSFFLNFLALAIPLYLLQIYSKVIPSQSTDTLFLLTIIALIAVVAHGFLDSVRRTILDKLGIKFDNDLSEHLLSSSIERSLLKNNTSVNVMQDLARLRDFVSGGAVLPLLDIPWTPMFLVILYFLHPALGAIGLIGVVMLVLLALYNEYRTRDDQKEISSNGRDLIDNARAIVRNSDVVQAMGMQQQVLSLWRDNNSSFLTETYHTNRTSRFLESVSRQARMILQVVMLCTAAWLILQNQLTPGATIVTILLFRRAISPLEQAIKSWKHVIRARAAYDNISEYLKYTTTLEHFRDMPLPKGVLRAEKATFRRSGQTEPIFSGANIEVEPGSIVAIVGPTGGGKSTLLQVLAGVLPMDYGQVTLDNFELDNWASAQLGESFGYLPQNVGLFPGTVRDNISRMADQPIEMIIEAAKIANAHDMIQSLPKGYDTQIEEDARNISGGQQQKIGLARALFGYPRYLFLDEPDANLDADGRRRLRRSLAYLRQHNVAIVLTTHRHSLEAMADVVYVLIDGKLSKKPTSPEVRNILQPPEIPKIPQKQPPPLPVLQHQRQN